MRPPRISNPVELLYLALMYRWETTAPRDRHEGLLDDEPARNTQITRLAYVLDKIAMPHDDDVYSTLARYTRRNDGHSYIDKDKSWMEQPHPLHGGWFFEGCTSLVQKQEIIQRLTKVGVSPAFVACADDFVSGKSIKDYLPTEAEEAEIIARIKTKEAADEA